MEVNNNFSNINFQAKFVKSDSLNNIVNYAIEKGKFGKLNQARKNIDNAFLRTRLKVDIEYSGEYPSVVFTKYEPARNKAGFQAEDYIQTNRVTYTCKNKKNKPLDFALRTIIKMGNNAPNNKLYKSIVVNKNIQNVNYIV